MDGPYVRIEDPSLTIDDPFVHIDDPSLNINSLSVRDRDPAVHLDDLFVCSWSELIQIAFTGVRRIWSILVFVDKFVIFQLSSWQIIWSFRKEEVDGRTMLENHRGARHDYFVSCHDA